MSDGRSTVIAPRSVETTWSAVIGRPSQPSPHRAASNAPASADPTVIGMPEGDAASVD
jgi:hypothetical protein